MSLSTDRYRARIVRPTLTACLFCAAFAGVNLGQAAPPSPNATAWFTEVTHELKLDFKHENGGRGKQYLPEIMAGGVALFDADNDGDLDIYLTNGHRGFPKIEEPGAEQNRFYRQGADGRFEDVTKTSGLGDRGYGMGVATGDFDNDGDVDVYVTNLGTDRLYRNRGDGTFEDITSSAGAGVDGWSASACFFDYDRDSFLDIYVSRYVRWSAEHTCYSPDGRETFCGPRSFNPAADVLLHNNGNATFTDVSESAGISKTKAAGLGVVCEDLNGDGWADVYVANDAYANCFWTNQHDGTFVDDAIMTGSAYDLNGRPEAGMGVVAGDLDRDGDTDLFMTHLTGETNTLYKNLGGTMGFDDATSVVGLATSSVRYTGFGTAALDAELDGDLDLVVGNGRVSRNNRIDGARPATPWDVFAEPNLFYTNNGSGRFALECGSALPFCAPVEITRGLATGDLDADGDIDLVVTNLRGPARVYRNTAPRRGSWLMVRAIDPRLHRDAIGARITLVLDSQRLVRTITRAFSYLSSSDPRAHFGVPAGGKPLRIEVDWPDGLREYFPAPKLNALVNLTRGTGKQHDQ